MANKFGFFTRRKAPWLDSDSRKRREAVDRIKDPSILKLVVFDERLSQFDPSLANDLRSQAIARIDSQDMLKEILDHRPLLDESLRYPIVEKLTDLDFVERLYRDKGEQGQVRSYARYRLIQLSDDQALLLELALNDDYKAASKLSLETCLKFLDGDQPFAKKAYIFGVASGRGLVFDDSYRTRFRTGRCGRCNEAGPNDSRFEVVSEKYLRCQEASPDMMPTTTIYFYRVKRRCNVCGLEQEYVEQRSND